MDYKYLYHLPLIKYNNSARFYKLSPLVGSDQTEVYIFSGKDPAADKFPEHNKSSIFKQGVVYLFIQTTKEVTEKIFYSNVERLIQILEIPTLLYARSQSVKIDQSMTFEQVLNTYSSEIYSDHSVSFGGIGEHYDAMKKIPVYIKRINGLQKEDYMKFHNALFTFSMANEIESYPNPHLKYTLVMTLLVSCINQLADEVRTKCGGKLKCAECGDEVNMVHKEGSEIGQIRTLIEDLFGDQKTKAFYLALTIKVYGNLRSGFLHSGKLSGKEMEGGFLSLGLADSKEILEDMVNLKRFCGFMLEQFLAKRSKSTR